MTVPHPIETRPLILASIAGNGNSNEILDEQEDETPQIKRLPTGEYLLDGVISVKDLNNRIPVDLPEIPDYNTLAGFILSRLGRIPVEGEEIAAGGVIFTVDKVSRRRVVRVKTRSART